MNTPYYITNPIGIDKPIQGLQKYLTANLSWLTDSFGRAYKNIDRDGKFYPEVFNSDNEYINVLANDFVSGMSFFEVVNDFDKNIGLNYDTTVRLIVYVKLDKAKPSILNRADENIVQEVVNVINNYANGFEFTKVVKGIKNVYRDYNLNFNEAIADTHPNFVCAFEMALNYDYQNSESC